MISVVVVEKVFVVVFVVGGGGNVVDVVGGDFVVVVVVVDVCGILILLRLEGIPVCNYSFVDIKKAFRCCFYTRRQNHFKKTNISTKNFSKNIKEL